MNRFATASLSALLAAGIVLPTLTTSAEARRGRGAALAIGTVIGLGAAAAIASRPAYGYYGERRVRRSSYHRYCRRLAWQCDEGSRRACWRYDEDC